MSTGFKSSTMAMLAYVGQYGPVTRPDIAKGQRLLLPTVISCVAKLQKVGYIDVVGYRPRWTEKRLVKDELFLITPEGHAYLSSQEKVAA